MSIEIEVTNVIRTASIKSKVWAKNIKSEQNPGRDLCLYKYDGKKLTLQFLIPDNETKNRNLKKVSVKINHMKFDSLLLKNRVHCVLT